MLSGLIQADRRKQFCLRYYNACPIKIDITSTCQHNKRYLDSYIQTYTQNTHLPTLQMHFGLCYALVLEHNYHLKNEKVLNWISCILNHYLVATRPKLHLEHIVYATLNIKPDRVLKYVVHREYGFYK